MPELIPSDEHEPIDSEDSSHADDSGSTSSDATGPADDADDAPTSVRDNWWWSPAFAIVIGVVVVLFQVGPITGSGGVWLNWVVAGVGIALAANGVVRLIRAYPR